MNSGVGKRLLGAWLALCAITLGYLAIDHAADDRGLRASEVVTIGAIAIALVKTRVIMREFMDVRHAPRALCVATDAIVGVMAVALIGCYLAGRAIG